MTKNSTKKIPRLRFKGFESEWEEKKLGDVASITGGGTPNTKIKEYWNGDINWYSPFEIGSQNYVYSSNKKITNIGLKNSSAKILPKNTVLFTSRAGIGKTAILKKEGCTNQGFQSIIPNQNKLDTYFIFCMSDQLKRYGNKMGSGSTFVEISSKEMKKMPLSLPNLKEQQKIGSFFAKLDQLIDLQSKKVEQLKKLKRGYLQKLFPQKGESVPRLRFDGFSGEWKEKKLKDISFSVSSSLTSKSILKNGNYPLYDASGVIGYINEFYSEHRYLSIIKDGSGAGKIKLMPKFTSVTGTMNYINSKDTNILFLYYLISTLNIKKFKLGTGIPHIYFKDYSKIPLFVPSLVEQRKIGEFLYNLDKNVRIISSNIYCIKELKKAYLQKIFVNY